MASLIAKKLSRLPIGTHVEITYNDGTPNHDNISGVITDSDFEANVEITSQTGEEVVLDFSIVRGVQVTKSLEAILKEIPAGTNVSFSFGGDDQKEPNRTGTVTDNDNEANVEITTATGEELVLSYGLIRSLLIKGSAASAKPAPSTHAAKEEPVRIQSVAPAQPKKTPLHQQTPEDILNASDNRLKELFDVLPREDRKKLNGAFDSFKYGVKINDREKMLAAANLARLTLFREEEQDYTWSSDAARFCGSLLRRVNDYDYDVYLVGECFYEAAYACWKTGKHTLAGAFAIVSLLEDKPENPKDLAIILANAVIGADDVSALPVLYKRLPANFEALLREIISNAFAAKSVNITAKQDIPASLDMLKKLYENNEMADEVEYWLYDEPVSEPQTTAEVKEEPAAPAKPAEPELLYGKISRLDWSAHTGVITADDGTTYSFRYQDIKEPALSKALQNILKSDLGGKLYRVKFYGNKNAAKDICRDVALVERARIIAANPAFEKRAEIAFEIARAALDTPDARRAMTDLIRYAMTLHTSHQRPEFIKEALELFEGRKELVRGSAIDWLNIAHCYHVMKKYASMLEFAEKAIDTPGQSSAQLVANLSKYLKMLREYYDYSGDKALLHRMMERIELFEQNREEELANEANIRKIYFSSIIPFRITTECSLDLVEAAEEDFKLLPPEYPYRENIEELLDKARQRQARKIADAVETAEEVTEDPTPEYLESVESSESWQEPEASEEEPEEDFLPYSDCDGWPALGLSKKDVIDYTLNIEGDDRIASILAYLNAASNLNPQITPVYRMVALAANDPLCAPDYSITALLNALEGGDAQYHDLTDYCMAAAFLRSSFVSGRGYDYSAQALRNSISLAGQIPALESAYDILEAFRKESDGYAIDIYADYRNHSVMQLKNDLDETVRKAQELYTKFVISPPRESAKFQRIVETKRILFDKDGYWATMLNHIAQRNQAALEAQRQHFVDTYLNGVAVFTAKQIRESVLDEIMLEPWELAGKRLQIRKSATLQGNGRNNLRSNIADILSVICQWYALSEQSSGLTWRTTQGEAAYQRLRPVLVEQLNVLSGECRELMGMEDATAQHKTGLFLLSATAQELARRLDGTWKFDQDKYLYADFLRSSHVMLNDDFLPELASTFCILKDFNILQRIRNHVEGEKHTFQERIQQIYSADKSLNNYGSAQQIIHYLNYMGDTDGISLPEQHERFLSQTSAQIDMRYRRFRETYAHALSLGQIIKSEAFCHTLENTVGYWYYFCKKTHNFGFFHLILLQASEQIHACAQQYEVQLSEQLDALLAGNAEYFATYPEYAEAIREQIALQNFTVAEDWMSRIRIGDFSLDVQQPEARGYLDRFTREYVDVYSKVYDGTRPLKQLIQHRDLRTEDHSRAQQLIDDWIDSENIERLLKNLGWQNIRVRPYRFPAEPRGEFYEVRKESSTAGLTAPIHPIAPYGTYLEKKRMYVACLYGTYDSSRLYEKLRAFDEIDGSKVILLDCALGQIDRRALARKLKQRESSLRNVNLVIDRVLLAHLAIHYNANLINRILMATAMPFSYFQPYVVESIHTMPPEIFIGRKDELRKIEQSDGVNLIFGGRQLGKSALFKKALSDIDGHNQQRAVLIDINQLDCAASALKISRELIDLGITPDAEPTEDWDVLSRNITRRLRNSPAEISYFLLMLDEADIFIEDCARCNYHPLVALKDIQQSLPGQFKYVLAGLHNIVKFNRQVALGNNSVITHMSSLKITPFRTPEAQELLTYPLSYLGFFLPSKVIISQILATCNYFPGLIQLYAKKLIESVRAADYAGYDIKTTPPYLVTDEHLRRVLADQEFMHEIHAKFEATLTLDESQGSYYYPLTLLIGWMYNVEPSKGGYTASDILRHAKEWGVYPIADLDEEKIDVLLQELQDLNVLRSVSSDAYLLSSKNFRDLLGSDDEIFKKLLKLKGGSEE